MFIELTGIPASALCVSVLQKWFSWRETIPVS